MILRLTYARVDVRINIKDSGDEDSVFEIAYGGKFQNET